MPAGARHDGPPPATPAAWLQTVAGAAAGTVSRAAITPLDVVKIRLQLQVEGGAVAARYQGTWHCLTAMVRDEGLAALWRGHIASQMLATSYCAVQVRITWLVEGMCSGSG